MVSHSTWRTTFHRVSPAHLHNSYGTLINSYPASFPSLTYHRDSAGTVEAFHFTTASFKSRNTCGISQDVQTWCEWYILTGNCFHIVMDIRPEIRTFGNAHGKWNTIIHITPTTPCILPQPCTM